MKANISPRDFGDIFYAAVIRRVGTDVWLPLASVPEPLQLAICNEIRDTDTDSGEWEYFGERYEFLSESPSPVAPRPGCRTADQWAQSIVDSAEARIVGTKEWLSLSDCPSWVRDTVVQEIMDSASKSAAADPDQAERGLNQLCLACDLETPRGEWVVDAEDLPELRELYGANLVVLWEQGGPDRSEYGDLHDYHSGEYLRPATQAERDESRAAGPEGVILVRGRRCFVQE